MSLAERRWRSGRFSATLVHSGLAEAVVLLEGAGDASSAALAELHRSTIFLEAGAWEEAAAARRRAEALEARSEDHRMEAALAAHAALDAVTAHDLARAEECTRRALALDLAQGATGSRAAGLAHLALLRLHRGDLEGAAALGGEAVVAAGSGEGRAAFQERADLVLAFVAVERGDFLVARGIAGPAWRRAEEPAATLFAGLEALACAHSGLRAVEAEARLQSSRGHGGPFRPHATGFLAMLAVLQAPHELLAYLEGPDLDALVPGYGPILRHRLQGEAGPEPAPPPKADPADVRHVLLRLARRRATDGRASTSTEAPR
jgi:hypothetical protein